MTSPESVEIPSRWQDTNDGVHIEPPVVFEATSVSLAQEFLPSLSQRDVCHLLVDELPESALPELAESLVEMREFYLSRQAVPPAEPVMVDRRTGRITREEVRPAFSIEEE